MSRSSMSNAFARSTKRPIVSSWFSMFAFVFSTMSSGACSVGFLFLKPYRSDAYGLRFSKIVQSNIYCPFNSFGQCWQSGDRTIICYFHLVAFLKHRYILVTFNFEGNQPVSKISLMTYVNDSARNIDKCFIIWTDTLSWPIALVFLVQYLFSLFHCWLPDKRKYISRFSCQEGYKCCCMKLRYW